MTTDKQITLPIRPEILERHAQAMAAFGQPGTWLDAKTRTNILKESRQAPHCALCDESRNALSPYAVTGEHDVATNLPKSLAEVVHRLRTDSGRLTETWLARVLARGISAGAYIETVGLVATGLIIDSYSHAVGAPQAECPAAVAGEPSREENPNVFDGGAWLPMLDVVQEETDVGLPSSPNIFRAMGLVPSAIDHFFNVMRAHYSLQSMSFLLSRSQTEMIASRVSALNQCYY